MELNGKDLRALPSERKAKLEKLLARAPAALIFNEHTAEEGAVVFRPGRNQSGIDRGPRQGVIGDTATPFVFGSSACRSLRPKPGIRTGGIYRGPDCSGGGLG